MCPRPMPLVFRVLRSSPPFLFLYYIFLERFSHGESGLLN